MTLPQYSCCGIEQGMEHADYCPEKRQAKAMEDLVDSLDQVGKEVRKVRNEVKGLRKEVEEK